MNAARRRRPTLLLVLGILLGAVATAVPAGAASAAPAGQSRFVPVTPCRLLDTRDTGRAAADSTVPVAVTGLCDVPPGATAIAATVVAVTPATGGFVTAYPDLADRPKVATLNYAAGEVRANGAIVPLSDTGWVYLYTLAESHLTLDVTGYWVPQESASRAGRVVPEGPRRLLDTRDTHDTGRVVRVDTGMPGYTAAVVNVTVTGSDGPMFATAHSGLGALPKAATVNTDAVGQTRGASTIVPLAPDGSFVVARPVGWAEIIVDLTAVVTSAAADESTDGLFVPLPPTRLVDTRDYRGALEVCLPAGGTFRVSSPVDGAGMLAGNLAIVPAGNTAGFLSVAPDGLQSTVGTAAVNVTPPEVAVSNLSVVGLDWWGDFGIFASHGADAVFDATGYFLGEGPDNIADGWSYDECQPGFIDRLAPPPGPGGPWPRGAGVLPGPEVPDSEWAGLAAQQCVAASMREFVQRSGYVYIEDHSGSMAGVFGTASSNGELRFNRLANEAVPGEFCGTIVHETFHAIDFILAGWGPRRTSDPQYQPDYIYSFDRFGGMYGEYFGECMARASETIMLGVPPSLSYADECGPGIRPEHEAATRDTLARAGIFPP